MLEDEGLSLIFKFLSCFEEISFDMYKSVSSSVALLRI